MAKILHNSVHAHIIQFIVHFATVYLSNTTTALTQLDHGSKNIYLCSVHIRNVTIFVFCLFNTFPEWMGMKSWLVYCNFFKEVRLGGWGTEGLKASSLGQYVSAFATFPLGSGSICLVLRLG